jgi:2-polyprenyl-6-methoxyphenol hydroxylase-like FAD-dependent oxidoreductase
MSDYQVIIVGGRPAGASLAIWLGRHNIKTLMVDRATFPSLPSVPSGPMIYSHHMDKLEELGILESALFHADGRIDAFVVAFVNYHTTAIPMSAAEGMRPYAYGADRAKFDAAIWEHASKAASVTARSGFSVTGILKENGKVKGIKGQSERGKEECITADLVVGADGRFSFMAQQSEAAILEEYNDHITNSYQADWENVADGVMPNAFTFYSMAKGFAVLMIPIDTRKYIVAMYMRPEHHKSDRPLEAFYQESLQAIAPVAERLKAATRVTPVVGIKGIRNGYRQPIGDGWALVGDAFHYKDPLDGQGIYDALVEAKYLGEAIHQWQNGGKSWQEMGQHYAEQARDATHAMLLQTVSRVKDEMFRDPPPFIIKTLVRWVLNSPECQRDMIRRLTRKTDPKDWQMPGAMRRAVMRGIANDLFHRGQKTVSQLPRNPAKL